MTWFRDNHVADQDTACESPLPPDTQGNLRVVVGNSKVRAGRARRAAEMDRSARASHPQSRTTSPVIHSHGFWRRVALVLMGLPVFLGGMPTWEGVRSLCPCRVTVQVDVRLERETRWRAQVTWFRDILVADQDMHRYGATAAIELGVLRKELDGDQQHTS